MEWKQHMQYLQKSENFEGYNSAETELKDPPLHTHILLVEQIQHACLEHYENIVAVVNL